MKRLIILSAILCLFTSSVEEVQLDEKNTNAMMKASYVYNFAKLVSWPEKKAKGNFTIGVLGDPDLYQQLIKKYSGKQIGNQAIEIIQLLGVAQMPDMHILFISRKLSEHTGTIVTRMEKENSMLITEYTSGLSEGATLNFVVVDNQLKFEINESNAAGHGLIIGSTLKSLAHKLVK